MKEHNIEIAIIGSGTAGLSAFRAANKHTESVVMIEGGPYGTTCARVGCMPSKLLIAAAEAAHGIEKSPGFGIHAESVHIDGQAVMKRVRDERDRFVGFVIESIDEIDEKYKLKGYAHFIDDHTLQIDDHTRIKAKTIVIATGSSPHIFPIFKEAGDRLIINDDVFDWDTLPKSVAVFGPGVIGLELGQALHRLGVRITMFGTSGRVGPLSDPDLQAYGKKIFQSEFKLEAKANVQSFKNTGTEVEVIYLDDEGQEQKDSFEYILAATGRRPNLTGLKLENTSLPLDEKGIPKFNSKTLQIASSHVFIAGDVNNESPLLHEAADEGRIAGHNAGLYPQIEIGKRRSHLGVVFSDPQMASVGSLHKDLPHHCFVTGSVSFENQGRSRVMLKNKGRLHIYAESGTGLFLGAEMIGPAAEHMGHLLSWAHQQKMTINDMLEMPFYHPVIEEGIRTALRDAQKKLKKAPQSPPCFEHQ